MVEQELAAGVYGLEPPSVIVYDFGHEAYQLTNQVPDDLKTVLRVLAIKEHPRAHTIMNAIIDIYSIERLLLVEVTLQRRGFKASNLGHVG